MEPAHAINPGERANEPAGQCHCPVYAWDSKFTWVHQESRKKARTIIESASSPLLCTLCEDESNHSYGTQMLSESSWKSRGRRENCKISRATGSKTLQKFQRLYQLLRPPFPQTRHDLSWLSDFNDTATSGKDTNLQFSSTTSLANLHCSSSSTKLARNDERRTTNESD